jgi:hypothetical protein
MGTTSEGVEVRVHGLCVAPTAPGATCVTDGGFDNELAAITRDGMKTRTRPRPATLILVYMSVGTCGSKRYCDDIFEAT